MNQARALVSSDIFGYEEYSRKLQSISQNIHWRSHCLIIDITIIEEIKMEYIKKETDFKDININFVDKNYLSQQ